MLDALSRLVSYPSVTGTPYVYDALEYCLTLCQDFGFRTKNCNALLGYAEAGEGSKLIGVLVHLDVVPAGDGWESDPFTARITDDKIFGRGVADDKGPAIATIYAVKDLLDQGLLGKKRIRIIFGCSEENGEWTDLDYYKETEELPQCGFTPDAEFPLIYAEKGIANILLSMDLRASGLTSITAGEAANVVPAKCHMEFSTGEGFTKVIDTTGKPAHGSTPEEGINAIHLAMKDVLTLTEAPFAKFFLTLFEGHNGKGFGCDFQDEQSGEITFNPGMAYCEENKLKVALDVRYPVTFTAENVLDKLKGPCADWQVQVQLLSDERPMFADKHSPLAETLLSAYRQVTGDMSEPIAMGGGTYARAMDNIVAFGPVFPGHECTEHQCNEYLLIEDLYRAREIYTLALSRL